MDRRVANCLYSGTVSIFVMLGCNWSWIHWMPQTPPRRVQWSWGTRICRCADVQAIGHEDSPRSPLLCYFPCMDLPGSPHYSSIVKFFAKVVILRKEQDTWSNIENGSKHVFIKNQYKFTLISQIYLKYMYEGFWPWRGDS